MSTQKQPITWNTLRELPLIPLPQLVEHMGEEAIAALPASACGATYVLAARTDLIRGDIVVVGGRYDAYGFVISTREADYQLPEGVELEYNGGLTDIRKLSLYVIRGLRTLAPRPKRAVPTVSWS